MIHFYEPHIFAARDALLAARARGEPSKSEVELLKVALAALDELSTGWVEEPRERKSYYETECERFEEEAERLNGLTG